MNCQFVCDKSRVSELRFLIAMQRFSLPLVLLARFLLVTNTGANAACPSASQPFIVSPQTTSDRRSDFCILQATLMRAAWMRELRNGSCQLFEACTTAANEKSMPPIYRRLRPGSQSLLLRCRADRGCNPYSLLLRGSTNATLAGDDYVSGDTYAYRSRMIDAEPSLLSHIHLLLMNADGKTVVNLTFSLNGRVLDEGAWFSKSKLVAAWPWKLSDMTNFEKYYDFSMKGLNANVRFYIKTNGNYCNDTAGYLRIYVSSGRNSCSYSSSWSHPMTYLWSDSANSDSSPDRLLFSSYGQVAMEFRLYGTLLDSDFQIYKRID